MKINIFDLVKTAEERRPRGNQLPRRIARKRAKRMEMAKVSRRKNRS